MRRMIWAAVAAMSLGACAPNVKLLQRDGCWVKQTEHFPKTISEEIGFCSRKTPVWSNDRVTRLVQECMAEADYRWQIEALNAWTRGGALPKQESQEEMMKACMDRTATTLVVENEGLKRRVAELTDSHSKLEKLAAEDREHFRAAQEQMTEALGEAAKKPAPSAFATANSDSKGTATNDSEQTSEKSTPNNTQINVPAPIVRAEPLAEAKLEERQPAVACVPDPTKPRKKGAPVICAKPEPGKLTAPEAK